MRWPANPAIRTLFGEPVALDDPGGFTVWRTGTVLAVLLGAWALLATTRITRGEEDAGRWDSAGRPGASLRVDRDPALWSVGAVSVLVGAAICGGVCWSAGTDATGAAVHGAGHRRARRVLRRRRRRWPRRCSRPGRRRPAPRWRARWWRC